MKPENAKPGMKVKVHPAGSELIIKSISFHNARLVKILDDGSEEDWGICTLSLLDEVER